MSGRYQLANRRLRIACAAAWLLVGAAWSWAAPAVAPAIYPQTGCPPLVLPVSWQPPVLAQTDDAYDPPADQSTVVVLNDQPPTVNVDETYTGGDCQTCRTGTLFGWHYDDFMWGCGGWPFQTGPGCCDTWKVGPVWDVSVDGMTLFRTSANLAAITAQAAFDTNGDPLPPPDNIPEFSNQFDYGGGARVFATGTLPRCAGYRLQFGYEGVEEWNASVVFPKRTLVAADNLTEQRRVHLVSSMQSAEFNFDRPTCSVWRAYAGIRYLRFNDQLSDLIDQEASDPLPAPAPGTVTTVDTQNLFDLNNQLIGFQIGLHRDLWQVCRRFTLQGFANSGVYYNRVKRTNLMAVTTRQVIGYDTDDDIAGITDVTTSRNNDVAELSDVAYIAEASLTGIWRLNKCVALRGGYQVLWIKGLRLAENGYLGQGLPERQLTFQGWHAGIEYRR